MSLDISILGPDGSPKKQVSIGVDDHYRLMQLIGENGGLLTRLNDYYADAEFELTFRRLCIPSDRQQVGQEVNLTCAPDELARMFAQ